MRHSFLSKAASEHTVTHVKQQFSGGSVTKFVKCEARPLNTLGKTGADVSIDERLVERG